MNKPIIDCRKCVYSDTDGCRAFTDDREHYDECIATSVESEFTECKPKIEEDETTKI